MKPFAFRTIISAVIPAVLIIFLLALLIAQQLQGHCISHSHDPLAPLSGEPLSSLPDIYSVQSINGVLSLDLEKLNQAVTYFSDQNNPKAAADLIYIVQANNTTLLHEYGMGVRVGQQWAEVFEHFV